MASCVQIKSLLQAYLDGELGSGEKLLFEEHLRGCAACQAEMEAARAVTACLFEALGRDRLCDDLTPTIMAHLPEMEVHKTARYRRKFRTTDFDRHPQRSWFSRAATLVPVFVPIILLVLASVLWVNWPATIASEAGIAGLITYSDGPARLGHVSNARFGRADAKDVLVNGAVLKTDANARLLFGLTGPSHATLYENSSVQIVNHRDLVLEKGRIFLDVHRESRHFKVTTPHGAVRVLGTSFHVHARPERTEVTVVNGEVLVENDKSFALLTRGDQAVFQKGDTPQVLNMVHAYRYLEEARSVLPNAVAERLFKARFSTAPPETTLPTQRQIFMVETKRRPVSAIELNWVPDPYVEGHAGYTVYVSNSTLTPLFKTFIAPDLFQDKTKHSLRIATPPELREQAVSMLHITLIPDYGEGRTETSFTEVSAIGMRP